MKLASNAVGKNCCPSAAACLQRRPFSSRICAPVDHHNAHKPISHLAWLGCLPLRIDCTGITDPIGICRKRSVKQIHATVAALISPAWLRNRQSIAAVHD